MSDRFTHACCDECWKRTAPEGRQPIRLKQPNLELCCWCGVPTTSGIYRRENPGALRCRGRHERGAA